MSKLDINTAGNEKVARNLKIYGCVCRSLLELCRRRGFFIKEKDFLNQFSSKYPEWFSQPGNADLIILCEICKTLGLAQKINLTIDKDLIQTSFKDFRERRNNGILIFTERWPNKKGELGHTYHCMLLIDANKKGLKCWTSTQKGRHKILRLKWKDWDIRMFHGLVLNSFTG